MNPRSKYINAVLLPAILVVVGLLNLLQINGGGELLDRESRRRAPWPELSFRSLESGEYTRKLEDAFADRFFQRERALRLSDRITAFYGLPAEAEIHASRNNDLYNLGQTPVGGGVIVPAQAINGDAKKAEAPPEPPGQWVNQILIFRNQALTLAGYYEPSGAYYAGVLNTLADKLDPNVRVFSMLVPTAIEFLDAPKYRSLSYSQTDGVKSIYSKYSPRVRGIDAIAEMRLHSSEYIYFRTDHHWTGRGAYYAYRAAAKDFGFEPLSLDKYGREELPDYLGSLYGMTRSPALAAHPDTVELLYPPVEHLMKRHTSIGILSGKAVDKSYILGGNKYMAYIGGDFPFSEISTTVHNGRRILVLKDSYGNALVPFLVPHYEEIYVIDPRYWNGSVKALVKQKGIQDVLVLDNFVIVAGANGMAYHILRISG